MADAECLQKKQVPFSAYTDGFLFTGLAIVEIVGFEAPTAPTV